MDAELWKYNMAKVIVIDVTDDYQLMQPPLPSDYYPVLKEIWMPVHNLQQKLPESEFVAGYLYDWHESPIHAQEPWYVGVVMEKLLTGPFLEKSLLHVSEAR